MSKEDFVEIELDEDTYRALESEAKKVGLSVDEFAVKLVHDAYNALKAKES